MMLLFGKKNNQKQEAAAEKEKEEDPYAGFGVEEVAAPLQTDDLEYDEGFQMAIKTSHGRRPPGTSSGRPAGTAAGARARSRWP